MNPTHFVLWLLIILGTAGMFLPSPKLNPKVVVLPEEWTEFKPGDNVTVEHRNDTIFISFGGDAIITY